MAQTEFQKREAERIRNFLARNREAVNARRRALYSPERDKARRERNKEKLAAYDKARSKQKKATRRALVKKVGGKLSTGIATKLFFLQKGRCVVCHHKFGKKQGSYHLDHIMPMAKGGMNIDENVQLLCPPCNFAKGAKHPAEFMQAQGLLL